MIIKSDPSIEACIDFENLTLFNLLNSFLEPVGSWYLILAPLLD